MCDDNDDNEEEEEEEEEDEEDDDGDETISPILRGIKMRSVTWDDLSVVTWKTNKILNGMKVRSNTEMINKLSLLKRWDQRLGVISEDLSRIKARSKTGDDQWHHHD